MFSTSGNQPANTTPERAHPMRTRLFFFAGLAFLTLSGFGPDGCQGVDLNDIYPPTNDEEPTPAPHCQSTDVLVGTDCLWDLDADGIPNFNANGIPVDNCPDVANNNQRDTDGDGVGDDCDNCAGHANTDQADDDHNNIGNACQYLAEDQDNDCICIGLGRVGGSPTCMINPNCPEMNIGDCDDHNPLVAWYDDNGQCAVRAFDRNGNGEVDYIGTAVNINWTITENAVIPAEVDRLLLEVSCFTYPNESGYDLLYRRSAWFPAGNTSAMSMNVEYNPHDVAFCTAEVFGYNLHDRNAVGRWSASADNVGTIQYMGASGLLYVATGSPWLIDLTDDHHLSAN